MENKLLTDSTIKEVRSSNCFDFLRYLFAFSLILAHFCRLTDTEHFWFITGGMRVKAFFVITGFLVTYSLLRRNNLKSYAVKRFVRIIPAYVCCIFFCLCVGWWLTPLSTYDFFTSVQTCKYLIVNLLMTNWLEHDLPGVFTNHPMTAMNGSLWSMKQEVIFYFLVPLIVWLAKKYGKKRVVLPLVIVSCIVHNWCNFQTQYFMFFFSGMLVLLFLDEYYRHFHLYFWFSLVSVLATYTFDIPYIGDLLYAVEPVTFALMLIGIAYHAKPLNVFRRFDNITYGLYLYHFPVIQTLIHFGIDKQDKTMCFCMATAITAVFAALSWYIIEKPLINHFRKRS